MTSGQPAGSTVPFGAPPPADGRYFNTASYFSTGESGDSPTSNPFAFVSTQQSGVSVGPSGPAVQQTIFSPANPLSGSLQHYQQLVHGGVQEGGSMLPGGPGPQWYTATPQPAPPTSSLPSHPHIGHRHSSDSIPVAPPPNTVPGQTARLYDGEDPLSSLPARSHSSQSHAAMSEEPHPGSASAPVTSVQATLPLKGISSEEPPTGSAVPTSLLQQNISSGVVSHPLYQPQSLPVALGANRPTDQSVPSVERSPLSDATSTNPLPPPVDTHPLPVTTITNATLTNSQSGRLPTAQSFPHLPTNMTNAASDDLYGRSSSSVVPPPTNAVGYPTSPPHITDLTSSLTRETRPEMLVSQFSGDTATQLPVSTETTEEVSHLEREYLLMNAGKAQSRVSELTEGELPHSLSSSLNQSLSSLLESQEDFTQNSTCRILPPAPECQPLPPSPSPGKRPPAHTHSLPPPSQYPGEPTHQPASTQETPTAEEEREVTSTREGVLSGDFHPPGLDNKSVSSQPPSSLHPFPPPPTHSEAQVQQSYSTLPPPPPMSHPHPPSIPASLPNQSVPTVTHPPPTAGVPPHGQLYVATSSSQQPPFSASGGRGEGITSTLVTAAGNELQKTSSSLPATSMASAQEEDRERLQLTHTRGTPEDSSTAVLGTGVVQLPTSAQAMYTNPTTSAQPINPISTATQLAMLSHPSTTAESTVTASTGVTHLYSQSLQHGSGQPPPVPAPTPDASHSQSLGPTSHSTFLPSNASLAIAGPQPTPFISNPRPEPPMAHTTIVSATAQTSLSNPPPPLLPPHPPQDNPTAVAPSQPQPAVPSSAHLAQYLPQTSLPPTVAHSEVMSPPLGQLGTQLLRPHNPGPPVSQQQQQQQHLVHPHQQQQQQQHLVHPHQQQQYLHQQPQLHQQQPSHPSQPGVLPPTAASNVSSIAPPSSLPPKAEEALPQHLPLLSTLPSTPDSVFSPTPVPAPPATASGGHQLTSGFPSNQSQVQPTSQPGSVPSNLPPPPPSESQIQPMSQPVSVPSSLPPPPPPTSGQLAHDPTQPMVPLSVATFPATNFAGVSTQPPEHGASPSTVPVPSSQTMAGGQSLPAQPPMAPISSAASTRPHPLPTSAAADSAPPVDSVSSHVSSSASDHHALHSHPYHHTADTHHPPPPPHHHHQHHHSASRARGEDERWRHTDYHHARDRERYEYYMYYGEDPYAHYPYDDPYYDPYYRERPSSRAPYVDRFGYRQGSYDHYDYDQQYHRHPGDWDYRDPHYHRDDHYPPAFEHYGPDWRGGYDHAYHPREYPHPYGGHGEPQRYDEEHTAQYQPPAMQQEPPAHPPPPDPNEYPEQSTIYGGPNNFEPNGTFVNSPNVRGARIPPHGISRHPDQLSYVEEDPGYHGYPYYHHDVPPEQPNWAQTQEPPPTEPEEPPVPIRKTPELFAHPHVRAKFAPGGTLVVVLPHNLRAFQPAQVELSHVTETIRETEMTSFMEAVSEFPGPLMPGETPKSVATKYASGRAEQCRVRERAEEGEEGNEEVARECSDEALLWDLLVLLCQQNGVVVASDVSELLMREKPPAIPARTHVGSGDQEEALDNIRQLLIAGRKRDSLELACNRCLWGHALMLASQMDEQSRTYVINRFTASLLTIDPLSTFYTLMLGRTPSVVRPEGLQRAGSWRPHLAMILANRASKLDNASIITLGDSLLNNQRIHAAHFCYHLAEVQSGAYGNTSSKYMLLGVPNSHLQLGLYPRPEYLRMMEVLEYAMSLSKQEFVLPHFQVFKYLHALRLTQAGMVAQAFKYCEQIAVFVRRSPGKFPPALLSSLSELSTQLHHLNHPHGVVETELPSWLLQLQQVVSEVLAGNYESSARSTPSPAFSSISQTYTGQQTGQPIHRRGSYLTVPGNTFMYRGSSGETSTATSSKEGSVVGAQVSVPVVAATHTEQDQYQPSPLTLQQQVAGYGQPQEQGEPQSEQFVVGTEHAQNVGNQFPGVEGAPPIESTATTISAEPINSEAFAYDYANTYGASGSEGHPLAPPPSSTTSFVPQPPPSLLPSDPGGYGEYGTSGTASPPDQQQPPPTQPPPARGQPFYQPLGGGQQYGYGLPEVASESGAPPQPQMNSVPGYGGVGYWEQQYGAQGGMAGEHGGGGGMEEGAPEISQQSGDASKAVAGEIKEERKEEEEQKSEKKDKTGTKKDQKEKPKDQAPPAERKSSFLSYFMPWKREGPPRAKLPSDKDPRIVWDEKRKKWVDLDADEEEEKELAAPPTDNELRTAQPSKGVESTDKGPPPPGTNVFSRQAISKKGRLGARSKYVDVMNPSGGGGGASQLGPPPGPPPPLVASLPTTSFFVPQQPMQDAHTPTADPQSGTASGPHQQPPQHQPMAATDSSHNQPQHMENQPPQEPGGAPHPPAMAVQEVSSIDQLVPVPNGHHHHHQPSPPEPQAPHPPPASMASSQQQTLPQSLPQSQVSSSIPAMPQFFNPSAFAPVSSLPLPQPDSQDDAQSTISELSQEVSRITSHQLPPSRPLTSSAGYSKLRQGIRGPKAAYPSIPQQQRGQYPRTAGLPPKSGTHWQ